MNNTSRLNKSRYDVYQECHNDAKRVADLTGYTQGIGYNDVSSYWFFVSIAPNDVSQYNCKLVPSCRSIDPSEVTPT